MPLDLQPYRVHVSIAFASDPLVTVPFRQDVLQRTAALIDRTQGQMWRLEGDAVHDNRWLAPTSVQGLERLTADALQERFGEAGYDKVFFVTLEASGARLILSGREWDANSRQLSPVASRETYDRRAVPETAVALVQQLFRPLVAIETAEADAVQLRLQAGELLPSDPDAVQLRQGDILQPYFRYRDRQQVVQKIQSLPLTYLVVDSVERGRVSSTLVSGLRLPVGGKKRRVDQMAISVRPVVEATQVRLVPRNNPSNPLVGHQVVVVPKTRVKEEPVLEPSTLLTDRAGSVSVPFLPEQPVVWLYVHSGSNLLARVPFVPGLEPRQTIELPDDSLRLSVEGEVSVLRGRLIDTVAKRAVCMARALQYGRAGDWKNAPLQLAELEKLPTAKEFQSQLTAIRVSAVEQAQRQRDRAAESRINKLCGETAQTITQYLDPDKIRQLKEELNELRKLDNADRAALSTK